MRNKCEISNLVCLYSKVANAEEIVYLPLLKPSQSFLPHVQCFIRAFTVWSLTTSFYLCQLFLWPHSSACDPSRAEEEYEPKNGLKQSQGLFGQRIHAIQHFPGALPHRVQSPDDDRSDACTGTKLGASEFWRFEDAGQWKNRTPENSKARRA